MEDDLFGEVISRYSREDALEDGVLIDISKMAREAGIRFPVAITSAVWGGVVEPDQSALNRGESVDGRLWDVLYMLYVAIKRSSSGREIHYSLIATQKGKKKTHDLKAVCGPGDEGEPVITIMYPGED